MLLLLLIACLPTTGLIADDTGPGMVGDGACMWICSEEFRYWETDYEPTADSECYDKAAEVCGSEPYGTRWEEVYPEEVCCVKQCGGGVGHSPNVTTQEECDQAASDGCEDPVLAVYSCEVY